MGFPTAEKIDNVAAPLVTQSDARSAAAYVADRLGDECRDVLEALGLIGYVGHDKRTQSGCREPLPVWRIGAVTR